MRNQPGLEEYTPPPSGRLVLPGPEDDASSFSGQFRTVAQQGVPIHPGLLVRQNTSPAPPGLLPKLSYYWRKDPAYKVFMLSIVMVLLASIVFLALASSALSGKSTGTDYPQNPPTGVTPSGTIDLHPTFTTPGGGKGSGQSSQPPAQSTPVLGSTPSGNPTAQPTQPQGGTLTVQISNIPGTVRNNSRVPVTVSTNEPGVQVELEIRYNVSPGNAFAGPKTTDGNGNATINWNVLVFSFGHKTVQAQVFAVAVDQNGQRAISTPVTVQVIVG